MTKSGAAAMLALAFLVGPSLSLGSEPALELPPWAEVAVRFAAPPEIGRPVEVVGELHVLVGQSGSGRLFLELPPELRLVRGQASTRARLAAGARERLSVVVQAERPCPAGAVVLTLSASVPKKGLEAEVRRAAGGDELVRSRLGLLAALAGKARLTAVAPFAVGRDEAVLGPPGPSWEPLPAGGRGPSYLVRPTPRPGTVAELRAAVAAFEAHERLLASSPRLRALVASSHAESRRARRAEYGEDLYSLAARLARDPGAADEALALARGLAGRSDVLPESAFAARNLEGVLLARRGKPDDALRAWAEVAERQPADALTGYVLFNAGELCAAAGRAPEAREHWRQALALRPGLTVARRRLP